VRPAYHFDRRRKRALETEAAIDEVDVVVDGLGYDDDPDAQAAALDFRDDAHGSADAAVAADHEQDADAVGFQVVDHLRGFLRSAGRTQQCAAFVMDVRDRFRRQRHHLVAESRDEPLVAIAEAEDALHAVAARQFQHDSADDVVEAGAQSAAGNDAAPHRARVEENPVARTGQFEGRQSADAAVQARGAVVDQYLVGRTDELKGVLSEVGRDRGGQQASAEVLDGYVPRRDSAREPGRTRNCDPVRCYAR